MFNFQDDYIFQRLGYQEEAKKLKNFSQDAIKAQRVALENVSFRDVTEQDLKDFSTYRKLNPFMKDSLIIDIFLCAFVTLVDIWFVKAIIYTYQTTPFSEIMANPVTLLSPLLPFALTLSLINNLINTQKRKAPVPWAAIDAFLVSVHRMDDTLEGDSAIPEESFLDLWVPTEKCFIYHLEAQASFKYTDNQTHIWSDFVYTPVKIIIYHNHDYLVIPTFSAKTESILFDE